MQIADAVGRGLNTVYASLQCDERAVVITAEPSPRRQSDIRGASQAPTNDNPFYPVFRNRCEKRIDRRYSCFGCTHEADHNYVSTTILPPASLCSMQRCASTISSRRKTLPGWTCNAPSAICSASWSSGVSMKSSAPPL